MKHYFRFAPPLIVTEAEIRDIVGRIDIAIKRAMDGFPKEVDVRESEARCRLAIGRSRPSEERERGPHPSDLAGEGGSNSMVILE